MRSQSKNTANWKDMFRFTKEGRLQSMDLMYAFFLGIGILFVDFIIGNRLTLLFEDLFPEMSRTGKNILGIAVPALCCALIALLIFRIIRKKKITVMAYGTAVLLVLIILVILLFELDSETIGVLIPAYIGIFLIPAAAGMAAVLILFRKWLRANPDPLREDESEKMHREQPDGENDPGTDNSEPDYSGWKQFR